MQTAVRVTREPSRNHEEATVESLKKDPALAAEYVNAVLEDGDQAELMLALRRLASAFGGIAVWPQKLNSMRPIRAECCARRAIQN